MHTLQTGDGKPIRRTCTVAFLRLQSTVLLANTLTAAYDYNLTPRCCSWNTVLKCTSTGSLMVRHTFTNGIVMGSWVTTVRVVGVGAPSVNTVASRFAASNSETKTNHVDSILRSRWLWGKSADRVATLFFLLQPFFFSDLPHAGRHWTHLPQNPWYWPQAHPVLHVETHLHFSLL